MPRRRPWSRSRKSTTAICWTIRKLAAGTLPGFYVEAVAVAERGAWPLPLPDHYAWDAEHLAEYARLAATDEASAYLDSMLWRLKHDTLVMTGLCGIPLACHPADGGSSPA